MYRVESMFLVEGEVRWTKLQFGQEYDTLEACCYLYLTGCEFEFKKARKWLGATKKVDRNVKRNERSEGYIKGIFNG